MVKIPFQSWCKFGTNDCLWDFLFNISIKPKPISFNTSFAILIGSSFEIYSSFHFLTLFSILSDQTDGGQLEYNPNQFVVTNNAPSRIEFIFFILSIFRIHKLVTFQAKALSLYMSFQNILYKALDARLRIKM